MANDRLRIRCKFCKDHRMIYKYYPKGGFIGGGYANGSDNFSEWMDKHVQECNPKVGFDMGGEITFELYCENTEDPDQAAKIDIVKQISKQSRG